MRFALACGALALAGLLGLQAWPVVQTAIPPDWHPPAHTSAAEQHSSPPAAITPSTTAAAEPQTTVTRADATSVVPSPQGTAGTVATTATTVDTETPGTAPQTASAPALPLLASLQQHARDIPGGADMNVVLAPCFGGTSRSHWGFYLPGRGSTVFTEPDGATVRRFWDVCINPKGPDPMSTLAHELGHAWFDHHGKWQWAIDNYNGAETAAECFAQIWGATTFGSGGCPPGRDDSMRQALGW